MTTVVPLESKRGVKAAERNASNGGAFETSWSGEFDEDQLVRPGGALMAALQRRANELGHSLVEMAQQVGVTYGYISQLRNGKRQTSAISHEFSVDCAAYLGCPRLSVLGMAGVVTPEDLYAECDIFETEVPRAMQFLEHDPVWGHLVTPEVANGTPQTKYLVIRLYEEATKLKLLPERIVPARLADSLVALENARAGRIAHQEAIEQAGS